MKKSDHSINQSIFV